MGMVEQELKEAIIEYVRKKGGPFSGWYVGVSKKPDKSIFKDHKVPKKGSPWFYKFASDSMESARVYEQLLMMGFDGDKKSSDPGAFGVYVYRKSKETKE
ncbi:MAG: hypothetical protein ACLFP1_06455 [Candidatus Goldiibacteriota bacterium]